MAAGSVRTQANAMLWIVDLLQARTVRRHRAGNAGSKNARVRSLNSNCCRNEV
jgi:hypothetical protein